MMITKITQAMRTGVAHLEIAESVVEQEQHRHQERIQRPRAAVRRRIERTRGQIPEARRSCP